MEYQYRISNANAVAITVAFSPISLSVPIILLGLTSYWHLWIGLTIGVLLEIGMWYGWSRGTYITIDGHNNIYNTFFFIRREATPLSRVVSLIARHPLAQIGTTSVWKVYRDEHGQQMTRSLTTKEMLKENEFKGLVERIHTINPEIEIAEELLK